MQAPTHVQMYLAPEKPLLAKAWHVSVHVLLLVFQLPFVILRSCSHHVQLWWGWFCVIPDMKVDPLTWLYLVWMWPLWWSWREKLTGTCLSAVSSVMARFKMWTYDYMEDSGIVEKRNQDFGYTHFKISHLCFFNSWIFQPFVHYIKGHIIEEIRKNVSFSPFIWSQRYCLLFRF